MLRHTRTVSLLLLSAVVMHGPAAHARSLSITLGDMDGGLNNGPGTADDVYADLDWQVEVFTTAPASWPMVGFDFPRKESQVLFTFEYDIGVHEIVTDATLTLSIRGVDSKVNGDVILLDDITNAYNYNTLGWNPISLSVVSERSIDLSQVGPDYLIPTLQDGQFNVSVRDDTLVDYARLDLTFGAPPTGDLNSDGYYGIDDLNIVLSHWNQAVTPFDPSMGDVSGDGLVGIEDLNAVLGNWNAGTPPTPPAPAPEPGTAIWVLAATALYFTRRT